MSSPLQIFYNPKSILGLIIAVGFSFLIAYGALLSVMPNNYNALNFFYSWGSNLVVLGIIVWLFYIFGKPLLRYLGI